MSPTITVILVSIVVIAIILLIKYIVNLGANKAKDAIRNAKNRSDMQNNPPKQESLADRYNSTNKK